MSGSQMIAIERKRQFSECGYSPAHDLDHASGELAEAAAVYALPAESRGVGPLGKWQVTVADYFWPGEWEFKPTPYDRVRELVKAGALIAAEIDRLIAEAMKEMKE